MAKRKAISKKIRFEVFKRDSFACQYCGKAAPDVILHVDHIDPVSKGGDNSIINLITSCADCNGGKSDRKLDDQSILAKQREQLTALSERREQLELMVQWRTALMALGNIELEALEAEAKDITGYGLNEADRAALKKLLKLHGLELALKTMRQSFDRYLVWEDSGPTSTSLSLAYVASHKPKTTGSVMQEPLQSQPVSQPATAGGESSGGLGAPDSKAKEIPK